jgi:hypothetical protein
MPRPIPNKDLELDPPYIIQSESGSVSIDKNYQRESMRIWIRNTAFLAGGAEVAAGLVGAAGRDDAAAAGAEPGFTMRGPLDDAAAGNKCNVTQFPVPVAQLDHRNDQSGTKQLV